MADADFIIIGSGFGGSVTACRLAEAGANVIVLERGREWSPSNFPRKPGDAWVWDDLRPAASHGWWDIRMFPHMTVAQGAGVGGGSLVYANISVEAKPETFDSGWPSEITAASLAPHYAEVGRMMEIRPVPQTQWPERTKLLKDAAKAAGWEDRFRPLGTAVRYDNAFMFKYSARTGTKAFKWPETVADDEKAVRTSASATSAVRCAHATHWTSITAGEKGRQGPAAHIVRTIQAIASGGYALTVNEISGSMLKPKTFTAKRVIVAAGRSGRRNCSAIAQTAAANVSAVGVGWRATATF
jgi:cholesterol oxidase